MSEGANEISRGDVFYIESAAPTTGSEMRPGRPAIIVSNNHCNAHSPVVEVVYLTTQAKTALPTHVLIRSTARRSIALCEQITSVAKGRIGRRVTRLRREEMQKIDAALMVSLNLRKADQDGNLPRRHGKDQPRGWFHLK